MADEQPSPGRATLAAVTLLTILAAAVSVAWEHRANRLDLAAIERQLFAHTILSGPHNDCPGRDNPMRHVLEEWHQIGYSFGPLMWGQAHVWAPDKTLYGVLPLPIPAATCYQVFPPTHVPHKPDTRGPNRDELPNGLPANWLNGLRPLLPCEPFLAPRQLLLPVATTTFAGFGRPDDLR